MEISEEQKEQIIEALGSAHYNANQIKLVGIALIPMVRRQIESAIKIIDKEWEPID